MHFNKLLPELYVSDFQKSLKFYTAILGFKLEYERKNPLFVFLSFNGSQIMIQQGKDDWQTGTMEYPYGRGINFQIDTPNITVVINSLKKHNYPLFRGIKDSWYKVGNILYGCREILVMDPDGYLLRFSQELGIKKAESDKIVLKT